MEEITDSRNLIWVDMEFTGLDDETEKIIEIASIITDSDLEVVAEGPVIAINQQESLLERMDEWNQTTHAKTGLTERVRKSDESHESAEEKTLDFIKQYIKPNSSPLCGNSIHTDRRFMKRYMPALEAYIHYRNIDVTSVKELAHRWYPSLKPYEKKNTHKALDDIRESINELKYYRQEIFL